MKVALYARVSTVDKNQNPEVQLAELREYCRRQDWEISEEYIDLASASDFVHRKAWARAMEDAAKRKYRALVVWKMDRAFRDIEMAWRTVKILRGYGIDMVFMTQPELNVAGPAGDLIFTIYAGFAQFERDIIRERSMAGMLHAKKCGTKSGNPIGKPRIDIGITILKVGLLALALIASYTFGNCTISVLDSRKSKKCIEKRLISCA